MNQNPQLNAFSNPLDLLVWHLPGKVGHLCVIALFTYDMPARCLLQCVCCWSYGMYMKINQDQNAFMIMLLDNICMRGKLVLVNFDFFYFRFSDNEIGAKSSGETVNIYAFDF